MPRIVENAGRRCEAAVRGGLRGEISGQRDVVPQGAGERCALDDEHRVVMHHSATRYGVRGKRKRSTAGLRGLDHALERQLRRVAAEPVYLKQVRARVGPVEQARLGARVLNTSMGNPMRTRPASRAYTVNACGSLVASLNEPRLPKK